MDLPFAEDPVSGLTGPAALPMPACSAAATALVMPEKLNPALHDGALRIVWTAPAGVQQDLLDELAGHLGMPRKTIDNPLGWLSTLVQKAQDGSLVLTMAPVIAAARARRQEAAERLPVLAPMACAPTAPDPEAAERAEQARARLRELRAGMAARAATTSAGKTGLPLDQSAPMDAPRPWAQNVPADDGRPLGQNDSPRTAYALGQNVPPVAVESPLTRHPRHCDES
jgi:hypothetical protein